MDTANRPVVAIVDTSEELAELLCLVAESAGGQPVVTYVPDLKRGQPDPAAFLTAHDPRLLFWDIALPYEENWAFFQQVCQSAAGQGRAYLLTTANKRVLEQLVGPTPAHEVVGKPWDLDALIARVQQRLGEPATPTPNADPTMMEDDA